MNRTTLGPIVRRRRKPGSSTASSSTPIVATESASRDIDIDFAPMPCPLYAIFHGLCGYLNKTATQQTSFSILEELMKSDVWTRSYEGRRSATVHRRLRRPGHHGQPTKPPSSASGGESAAKSTCR